MASPNRKDSNSPLDMNKKRCWLNTTTREQAYHGDALGYAARAPSRILETAKDHQFPIGTQAGSSSTA